MHTDGNHGDGLDRDAITRLIPHSGAMCLLDSVDLASELEIVCGASSHRDGANPLRLDGRLPAVAGIEYAAQAMAVHGALAAATALERGATPPRPGFLVALRGVELHVDRLDDVRSPLVIHAIRQSGDGSSLSYEFSVSASGRALIEGRAIVMLAPAETSDT